MGAISTLHWLATEAIEQGTPVSELADRTSRYDRDEIERAVDTIRNS